MFDNRLGDEPSPYLRQHADNPVAWKPWGEAAFSEARERDVPIFLSIGYATCHWCHVMAHESFEDDDVANLLNRAFVPVKVDREERPDVDAVYMTVCQMLTGHGGWPLTVLLTPDLEPFFAGTYFPRATRGGRIGMLDLLPQVESLWTGRRTAVSESAASITEALRRATRVDDPIAVGADEVEIARRALGARFDTVNGGFGGAPKFPSPHVMGFLLRVWESTGDEEALAMVSRTLDGMRRGGVHDQLGGGFHRYSTDASWRLPHFEKMLYDQALLSLAYVEAWQATGRADYAATARSTLDYVLRELTDPSGGFHSAEDADSDGEEGKFYVWTERDIARALEDEADVDYAVAAFGFEPEGNFRDEATGRRTGANVLLRTAAADADPERWDRIRQRLRTVRDGRVRPGRDDKVLADWNGLAIAALARAGAALGEPAYVTAAATAADFIEGAMRDPEGRLLHRWRAGDAAIPAFSSDLAALAWGQLELYSASFEPSRLGRCMAALDELLTHFREPDGALRLTAADAPGPLVAVRESTDGAIPSANSIAALTLLRVARLTGRSDLEDAGRGIIEALGGRVASAPSGHTAMLQAVMFAAGPTSELVVAGPSNATTTRQLLAPALRGFHPRLVVARKDTSDTAASTDLVRLAPFTSSLVADGDEALAYVCHDRVCERPTGDPRDVTRALSEV